MDGTFQDFEVASKCSTLACVFIPGTAIHMSPLEDLQHVYKSGTPGSSTSDFLVQKVALSGVEYL